MHNITNTINGVLTMAGCPQKQDNHLIFNSMKEYYKNLHSFEDDFSYSAKIFGNSFFVGYILDEKNKPLSFCLDNTNYFGLIFGTEQLSKDAKKFEYVMMRIKVSNKARRYFNKYFLRSLSILKEKDSLLTEEDSDENLFRSMPEIIDAETTNFKLL